MHPKPTKSTGHNTGQPAPYVLPLTMPLNEYGRLVIEGGDRSSFDADGVTEVPDGTPEVSMYPNDVAPGNFGLLNVGTPDNGSSELVRQIQ